MRDKQGWGGISRGAWGLILGPWLTVCALAAEPESVLRRNNAFAQKTGHEALQIFRPAYNVAVGISDEIFDVLRVYVLQPVFRGVHSEIVDYRKRDSYDIFEKELRRQEARFIQRMKETYPDRRSLAGQDDQVSERWAWAGGEQVSIVMDSFQDALLDRYRIESLEAWAARFAQERRELEPGEISLAMTVGGGFLYFNGIHSESHLGPVRLNVDVKSARSLLKAIEGGTDLNRAAALELGWKNSPLSLASAWDVRSGGLRSQNVALKYRLSF